MRPSAAAVSVADRVVICVARSETERQCADDVATAQGRQHLGGRHHCEECLQRRHGRLGRFGEIRSTDHHDRVTGCDLS